MAENRLPAIEEQLSGVPNGKLLIRRHTPEPGAPLPSPETVSCPDGKGLIESWGVFPGILLTHSMYLAGCYDLRRPPSASVMEINHCRFGRAGWNMRGGGSVCLKPGELSLHMTDGCADASVSLPLGCYEGIAVTADLDILEREFPEILREAGIGIGQLARRFCARGRCTVMPAGSRIERVFSELYAPPPRLRLPYFKLKVQELLLFLSMPEGEEMPDQDPPLPVEKAEKAEKIETIRAIHRQLTEHLDRRFTIEELSRQYLINTSSLKAVFKSVYGAPVAAYMKEYRIQKAAGLLRETEDSVAEIAARVGYENQSKFTAAFKDVMQTLPTAYRRRYRGCS